VAKVAATVGVSEAGVAAKRARDGAGANVIVSVRISGVGTANETDDDDSTVD